MLYINGSEKLLNQSFYYKITKKAYNLKLAVKYSEKRSEFTRNNKKVLRAIKLIVSLKNSK